MIFLLQKANLQNRLAFWRFWPAIFHLAKLKKIVTVNPYYDEVGCNSLTGPQLCFALAISQISKTLVDWGGLLDLAAHG